MSRRRRALAPSPVEGGRGWGEGAASRSAATLAAALLALVASPALADGPSLPNRVAQLQGLDKVTARVSAFDAPVGKEVRSGRCVITARACLVAPPTEPPESAAFLEILRCVPPVLATASQVFSGWMFASSPPLSALEHPVYDVLGSWAAPTRLAGAGPGHDTAALVGPEHAEVERLRLRRDASSRLPMTASSWVCRSSRSDASVLSAARASSTRSMISSSTSSSSDCRASDATSCCRSLQLLGRAHPPGVEQLGVARGPLPHLLHVEVGLVLGPLEVGGLGSAATIRSRGPRCATRGRRSSPARAASGAGGTAGRSWRRPSAGRAGAAARRARRSQVSGRAGEQVRLIRSAACGRGVGDGVRHHRLHRSAAPSRAGRPPTAGRPARARATRWPSAPRRPAPGRRPPAPPTPGGGAGRRSRRRRPRTAHRPEERSPAPPATATRRTTRSGSPATRTPAGRRQRRGDPGGERGERLGLGKFADPAHADAGHPGLGSSGIRPPSPRAWAKASDTPGSAESALVCAVNSAHPPAMSRWTERPFGSSAGTPWTGRRNSGWWVTSGRRRCAGPRPRPAAPGPPRRHAAHGRPWVAADQAHGVPVLRRRPGRSGDPAPLSRRRASVLWS